MVLCCLGTICFDCDGQALIHPKTFLILVLILLSIESSGVWKRKGGREARVPSGSGRFDGVDR